MPTRRQSGAVSRQVILWLCLPVILIALGFGGRAAVRFKYDRERANWKTMTLPQLATLSVTNEHISQELETLKANRSKEVHPQWTGERVLLMTNDEYLVYASRHGFDNGFVDHLFLARGSDGRWYYSTYHFCNHLTMLLSDPPPSSIAEFASRYAAREFDGKSDECLQHTWPGEQ
jgi:hypothetical protein